MRFQLIFLVLVFLISCQNKRSTQNKTPEKVTQLKIAAWNVEYSSNATAAEIGEALNPFNFDVVCFSEAPGGDWTKQVGEVMGLEYIVVGKYSTAGHVDKYKTIASRTPL